MARGADCIESNLLFTLLHTNLFVGQREHREPSNITIMKREQNITS
jgi:hypothetical protein